MRMMRQRMVRLIIPWTEEMMEMMMTKIYLDDEDEDEEDEGEEDEDEHLASADSAVVIPTDELDVNTRVTELAELQEHDTHDLYALLEVAQDVPKKKMTDKYWPQGEVKKLEIELWNLKVKGNDVPTYTNHFQELTMICTKFVANENEKIDKYISGLSDRHLWERKVFQT
nr:reverse transcriptase domain-containing protein [Tanacetum cinerariifolium]